MSPTPRLAGSDQKQRIEKENKSSTISWLLLFTMTMIIIIIIIIMWEETNFTRFGIVASCVQLAGKEFQSNNGVDDDDKDDEQSDVQEWHHGSQNGIEDHLQT